MKLGKVISNCRNPKTIKLRNGKTLTVPCGYCIDCAVSKANRNNALCQQAASSYPFVFKIDLSYSDIYVPKMKLYEAKDSCGRRYIRCIDVTKRPLKTKGKHGDYTSRFSTYGKCIHTINSTFDDELFKKFYTKSEAIPPSGSPRRATFRPLERYMLRYARYRDCQDFVKRLRFYLSQVSDSTFSYFAVSEYGPQTFRPHFHLVLFVDDPQFVSSLEGCVSKAWKFGTYVCELANNRNALTCYSASYLNSFTHLPVYLRGELVRPRSSHSFFLSKSVASQLRDYIYKDASRALGAVGVPYHAGVYKYFPTATNLRTLYPRTYDYGNKNLSELRELYEIYPKLQRIFGNQRCSDHVRDVMRYAGNRLVLGNNSFIINRLLNLCHISRWTVIRDSYGHTIDLSKDSNTPWLHLIPLDVYDDVDTDPINFIVKPKPLDDYNLRIYSRLYNVVRISKYVHDFCCEHVSFDSWFEMLVDVYKRLPLTRLGAFYEAQREYVRLTNDQLCEIFYPDNGDPSFDYQTVYENNLFVKHLNEDKDLQYSKRVKHKELNDANLIFC